VGVVMVVVAVLLVAALVVPLQPSLPKQVPKTGIIMPAGAGSNQLNFSPATIKLVIGVNNSVTWTNDDAIAHTVKSNTIPAGAQPFASDILSTGQTFTVTLTVPGTYTYFCTIHPAFMRGSIVVVNGTSSLTGESG
jgi:plastocyanin